MILYSITTYTITNCILVARTLYVLASICIATCIPATAILAICIPATAILAICIPATAILAICIQASGIEFLSLTKHTEIGSVSW